MSAHFTAARVTDLGWTPHVNLGCDPASLERFAPLKRRVCGAHHSSMMTKTIGGVESVLAGGGRPRAVSEWRIFTSTSTVSRVPQ